MYLTDAIKALTENTSTHIIPGAGGPVEYGTRMGERWYSPAGKNEPEEKPETADEIALGVIQRAGLTAKRE